SRSRDDVQCPSVPIAFCLHLLATKMGLLQVAATALALGNLALASPVQGRSAAAKYCAGDVCYSEWVSPEKIAYRIAIPDTATAGTFDILLQISAPKAVGWAGLAWGGTMVNNPLAVAWANGNTGIVSSRKARYFSLWRT